MNKKINEIIEKFNNMIITEEEMEELECNEFIESIEYVNTSHNFVGKKWYDVRFINGEDMDIYL